MRTATIKYDFDLPGWIAIADWNTDITGHSLESPQGAIRSLTLQCNKHDLWPKEEL